MILVDSNVPMYLVGAPHPHKVDAQRMLESLLSRGERLVMDAEIFQEILHRYVALRRSDAIQPAFDSLHGVVDEVLPIGDAEVERPIEIVLGNERLSARNAIHLAVMERHGIRRVVSFDRGFESHPGIERMS